MGSSASRDSGHATGPLFGESHFGSGELGPYVAPGSGAETDRIAEAAQPQSQQRFALSHHAAAAPQQQGGSDIHAQAGGYVLQDLTGTESRSPPEDRPTMGLTPFATRQGTGPLTEGNGEYIAPSDPRPGPRLVEASGGNTTRPFHQREEEKIKETGCRPDSF